MTPFVSFPRMRWKAGMGDVRLSCADAPTSILPRERGRT